VVSECLHGAMKRPMDAILSQKRRPSTCAMQNDHGEVGGVVMGVVQPPKHLHIPIVATCMCSHSDLTTCEGHHGFDVFSGVSNIYALIDI